jgi:hypothetical protein
MKIQQDMTQYTPSFKPQAKSNCGGAARYMADAHRFDCPAPGFSGPGITQ